MNSRSTSPRWLNILVPIIAGVSPILLIFLPIPGPKLAHELGSSRIVLPMNLPADPTTGTKNLQSRPLFSEIRRTRPVRPMVIQPQVNVPIQIVPSTNGIVLLGTLHVGTDSLAVVQMPGESYPRQIKVGSLINGWVVQKIMSDRVTVQAGNTSAELILPLPSNSSTQPELNLAAPMNPSSFSSAAPNMSLTPSVPRPVPSQVVPAPSPFSLRVP